MRAARARDWAFFLALRSGTEDLEWEGGSALLVAAAATEGEGFEGVVVVAIDLAEGDI